MVERQDIDALLISALYGELTPAEETRLASHLESHPADRTALDDLTRAREALHQSRILAFQYEPPQSISALLIQEASRRAPKKAPEGEGWFARFVRSFVQHPAMAAAAMIVVVVGAASIVSRNSDQQFAETAPVESKANESAPAVAVETPRTPDTAVAAPTGFNTNDQFAVGLADEQKEGGEKADKAQGQALPESDPNVAFYDASGASDRLAKTEPKGGDSLANKPPANKPADAKSGLEVRRRDPMPKDFDEAKPEPEPAKVATKPKLEQQYAPPADDALRGNREAAGYLSDGRTGTGATNARAAGGGATAPGAAAPTTPAPTTSPTTTAGPRKQVAPPPPPSSTRQEIATDTATVARDAKAKEKEAANDPNVAWAKDQHAALVTAVRANNCGRAANIALSIANRTPSYYAQNVETDRSVKVCIAYINREREKDAELRASRAKRSQLKNAEPSAPKRAADEPSRATSSDSSK